jgi:hypothetical protein
MTQGGGVLILQQLEIEISCVFYDTRKEKFDPRQYVVVLRKCKSIIK